MDETKEDKDRYLKPGDVGYEDAKILGMIQPFRCKCGTVIDGKLRAKFFCPECNRAYAPFYTGD